MKKLHFIAILCTILFVLTIGLYSVVGFINIDNAFADTYYSSITATSGTALLGQLHDLITTTHKTYTSYDDCKDPSIIIKTDPGTNGNVMEFYSQANISSKWGGGNQGTWNREHVWCQSRSNGLWGTSGGGGGDLHHIRPVESGLNSARGNDKYGEVENGAALYYEDSSNNPVALGGYQAGSVFEPLDSVKGDVARILMYVYTHYNTYSNVSGTTNGSGTASFGTLNFTNIVSADNEASAITMLLEWNALDPVDDIERTRNEAVYAIQGNRNPFIDDETFANSIWGNSTTIPTLTALSISPDAVSLSIGQTKQLSVTSTPITANKSVTWSSSNSNIATVSASGFVSAVANGTAIITATSTVNSEITAMASITVSEASSTVGDIQYVTINPSSFTFTANYGFKTWPVDEISGFAYIYGGSHSWLQFNKNQESYYLASNTALPGRIVSVTVKNYEGKAEREWKLLTSTQAYTQIVGKPTNGNDQGTKTVTTSGTTWNVTGNDTYFALTYEQSGTNSAAGYIDSITIGYVVDNEDLLTGLTATPSELAMAVGETQSITLQFDPTTADAQVTWSSSNTAIATVSDSGLVKAISSGSATITATSVKYPTIKVTISITVKDELELLNQKIEQAQADITNLTNELNTAKENLNQALSDITTANGNINELQKSITAHESAIKNAEKTAKEYAGIEDAKIRAELEEAISGLNTSLSESSALQTKALNALTERVDKAEQDIANLTNELNTAKENLNQALTDITTANGNINELQKSITAHESAIKNAEKTAKEYAGIEDAKIRAELEEAICGLNTSLSESSALQAKALNALTERVDKAEQDITNLTNELNTAKENLNQALSDITTANGNINELQKSITAHETAIKNAEKTAKEYAGIEDAKIRAELEEAICGLNTSLSESSAVQAKALNALTERVDKAEQDIANLTNELNTAKENLNQALTDITTANGSIENLKKAIESLDTTIIKVETVYQDYTSLSGASFKEKIETSLEDANSVIQDALKVLADRLETTEKNVDSLNKDLISTNQRIDVMDSELNKLSIWLIALSVVLVIIVALVIVLLIKTNPKKRS